MSFNASLLAAYKRIYDLPSITYREDVSERIPNSFKDNYCFVKVVVCNLDKKFLLLRKTDDSGKWELPEGMVKANESPEDTVHRVVFSQLGLEIDELTPIASIKHSLKFGGSETVRYGIAFCALSRGRVKLFPEIFQSYFTRKVSEETKGLVGEILQIASNKIANLSFNLPVEEIEVVKSKRYFFFYPIHKHLVLPISRFSLRKIADNIFHMIKKPPLSVLDASCGDSPLISYFYKRYKPKICIGNDISWRKISLYKNRNPNIVFTNHNVLSLPFKTKFDLVIFKNTLHHIDSGDQEKVIRNLRKIAKQLIVIDVSDPLKSGFLSKIWNRYYAYFLWDQGHSFLNYEEFKEMVKKSVEGEGEVKMDFRLLSTIKGKYCFASIEDQ